MIKELYDDINRYRRDKELNETSYMKLSANNGFVATAASELKVGDIVQVTSKQRVPADLILLRTTNASGCSFIKTDQLDGETDWKLYFFL